MRRYHILRFDVWLCLAISFGIALLVGNVFENVLTNKYAEYKEEKKVEPNEVGGVALDNIFRAQSVDDLLEHDVFTIVSPGIEYRNRGAGYFKGYYLYAVTLPSSEIVAARINSDSVKSDGDSIFSGNSTLPVGKIVKASLNDDESFLKQIEYSRPLSRKDFYIDMVGEAEVISPTYYVDGTVTLIQCIVVLVLFPLFHIVGSRIGIFPYIFPPKKKN